MAYNQKFGKERSNALADIAGKLKQGSGLGSTSDSAATMYGAPVHMKSGGSQIGHLSGINYGSPVHSEGHGAPEGHKHSSPGSDDYTYPTGVNAGGKNTRKSRYKLAKGMAEAANQGLDVQGHTTSGSGTKVKFKNKKLTVRGKVKGGYEGGQVEGQTELNKNVKVKARDIRKQLKKTNTATVKGGVISEGTTQTVTKKGSVKRDNVKSANASKKARVEGERSRAKLERAQAREVKKAGLAEKKAKIQAEKATRIEARKNSKKS